MRRRVRTGSLYLLHFHRRYYHAQHYLGYVQGGAKAVSERVEVHLSGNGSPLVRAVVAAGIPVVLAATWPGSRTEERRLKVWSKLRRLCPLCQLQP